MSHPSTPPPKTLVQPRRREGERRVTTSKRPGGTVLGSSQRLLIIAAKGAAALPLAKRQRGFTQKSELAAGCQPPKIQNSGLGCARGGILSLPTKTKSCSLGPPREVSDLPLDSPRKIIIFVGCGPKCPPMFLLIITPIHAPTTSILLSLKVTLTLLLSPLY